MCHCVETVRFLVQGQEKLNVCEKIISLQFTMHDTSHHSCKQFLRKLQKWRGLRTRQAFRRHDRTHRASTVSTAYESFVHCTSIPNIPYLSRAGFSSPKDQWGVLIHYYVKNDVNTLKTNHKMPVGKRDIITFCFFFLKKTWIEENADWIWSAETLLRVFVWVSPLKTLKCIQTKTQRFIQ